MFVKISITTTKKAIEEETIRLLSPFKDRIKTITSDNGFSKHKNISKALACDQYFCHPYSSWEIEKIVA